MEQNNSSDLLLVIDMQNVYYEAMSSARVRCFSVSDVEIIDDRNGPVKALNMHLPPSSVY